MPPPVSLRSRPSAPPTQSGGGSGAPGVRRPSHAALRTHGWSRKLAALAYTVLMC
jgi:hypothetical protein